MSDPNDSTKKLCSTFLDFCVKVRRNDPSVLPDPGDYFKIRQMSEKEHIELADALLENTSVTSLELLGTAKYPKNSAEAVAMTKYVRTSKHLQRIRWKGKVDHLVGGDYRNVQQREEMICSFLLAIQESTSLKELYMDLPIICRPANLALKNMLTNTESLRSLSLRLPSRHMDLVQSALKNNTTLRELTLVFPHDGLNDTPDVTPILTSLCDHPLLRRLCLHGNVVNLKALGTVLLLSDTSKITELDIHKSLGGLTIKGFQRVLRALERRPTLTKLRLRRCFVDRGDARLLGKVLFSNSSLQSLALTNSTLGSTQLAELAFALRHTTSIKVLDISGNDLNNMESAEILRDILCINMTITSLDLSYNTFGQTTGAVECIADGLGSNSSLMKIDLSSCQLESGGVSILAQTLGSRNTTLKKLTLDNNFIRFAGAGVLVETMEQSSQRITDLDLANNPIGNEGANLLARSLGNNALSNLTRLSLYQCRIGDDGFIALVSALEQNTSLLQLDLRNNDHVSDQAFLALAESLPDIRTLQEVDLSWCTGLASAMPLLLEGLRENTSLFRFHVANCAPSSVPPTPGDTARCAGGWMHEMERLGYRNRFLSLIRAPKERLPPRGVWPRALTWAATLPDVIFEVLRSKPNLVPSDDTGGKEATEDTGVPTKRKRGDE
jgi:Ran GTPase-activating protein (RanGAP) involved in mRNA processing and transport